jgi:RNA polymerase sigma-70 factor (ECF subfamily)
MPEPRDLKELGEALHRRLLARDDHRVTAEISELFLPPLARALCRRFPHLNDPHEIESAAIDSLMNYLSHPKKFDPARSSLLGYLHLDASRNLLNFLARRKKVVALHTPLPEYETQVIEAEDPETQLLAQASPLVQRALGRLSSPVDREVLALMMEGERRTEVYAAALGVADRPLREQAEIVKRHKDRIKKTLQREIKRKGRRQDGGTG